MDYSVSQQAADVLNMLNQEPGAHQNEGLLLFLLVCVFISKLFNFDSLQHVRLQNKHSIPIIYYY